MLTIPNARHISWCLRSQFISAGRDPKTSTLRLNGRIPQLSTTWQRIQFSASMVQSLPNWLFFQILKFSGPSLPGMTSSTLESYFLSGFIITMVIVISLACERKTVPNDYVLYSHQQHHNDTIIKTDAGINDAGRKTQEDFFNNNIYLSLYL